MKRILASLFLVIILTAPAWAGQCSIPPGGQCSLNMDPAPAPVEVVNPDQSKDASVLGFWLYSVQLAPRRVSAGLGPGEAAVFSPTQAKDGQGNAFAARTLVIFNIGAAYLSARTVK